MATGRLAYGLRNVPAGAYRGRRPGEVTDLTEIPRDWDEVVPKRCFLMSGRLVCGCAGDSMEPKFCDGDIAILLPGSAPTAMAKSSCGQSQEPGGVLCKIVMHVQLDKNLIKLSSYNPAYPPTEYHRQEFHWIFPVAAIIKQLRRR